MIGRLDRLRSHWGHLPAAAAGGLQLLCAGGLALSGLAAIEARRPLASLLLAVLGAALGLHGGRTLCRWRGACARARARRAAARELRPLATGGWSARHGLGWPGGGRIEHLAVSPDGGLSFLIGSPAGEPHPAELAELASRARWLGRAGRPCIAVCALPAAIASEDRLSAGILLSPVSRLADSLATAHQHFCSATGGSG